MQIDGQILRRLRTQRGWSRTELARRSGVSMRQVARIEKTSEAAKSVRETTRGALARALGVPPEGLTGEGSPRRLPRFTRSEQRVASEQPEASVEPSASPGPAQPGRPEDDGIAPKYRLAYDLVERQYGIGRRELANMAPFFLVLLAEGSLALRRKKIAEASEIIRQMETIDKVIPHVNLEFGTIQTESIIYDEENSISQHDLFGKYPREWGRDLDAHSANPFSVYLSDLTSKLDASGTVSVDKVEWEDLPDYNVFRDVLDEIANGCPYARKALETGHARINEIPPELEDDAEARQKWLSSKLPDDIRQLSPEELEEKRDFITLIHRATRANLEVLQNVLQAKKDEMHSKADGNKEGEDQ